MLSNFEGFGSEQVATVLRGSQHNGSVRLIGENNSILIKISIK